ncbi:dihydrolipoyllysine-residue acetyltransferase component 5 of pyruvate dehydrogenase complex [Olea europaea subsp. europaea]|uniref:Dihydrolipoyllysine-residue acetyltransferase component 5 of pyruvate dehydrogenase complex n=1 Tax=Olea europaea subsp. europaea TaxID=158383 RepID=A0A8S0PH64_OLEEU|nr:dihydrolipoyllysine-residue acetyltransferase component 5 of pyruvate dehydrogenase complex [Olea europaea subsp. europaea]
MLVLEALLLLVQWDPQCTRHPRGERESWHRHMSKKLAKELGMDLIGPVGSDPNGKIVAKDVEVAAAAKLSTSGGATVASEAAKPSNGAAAAVELESVVPFTIMQNALSSNMVESFAV